MKDGGLDLFTGKETEASLAYTIVPDPSTRVLLDEGPEAISGLLPPTRKSSLSSDVPLLCGYPRPQPESPHSCALTSAQSWHPEQCLQLQKVHPGWPLCPRLPLQLPVSLLFHVCVSVPFSLSCVLLRCCPYLSACFRVSCSLLLCPPSSRLSLYFPLISVSFIVFIEVWGAGGFVFSRLHTHTCDCKSSAHNLSPSLSPSIRSRKDPTCTYLGKCRLVLEQGREHKCLSEVHGGLISGSPLLGVTCWENDK